MVPSVQVPEMAIDISHYFKTIIPWVQDTLEFTNQLLLDPLNSVRLLNTAFIFQCCPAETRTLIEAAVTHIYGTTLPWECTVSVSGRRTIDTAPSLPGVMPISRNTM
jgi:hypothetical protein